MQENEQRTSIRENKSQTVNTVSVHDMKSNTSLSELYFVKHITGYSIFGCHYLVSAYHALKLECCSTNLVLRLHQASRSLAVPHFFCTASNRKLHGQGTGNETIYSAALYYPLSLK